MTAPTELDERALEAACEAYDKEWLATDQHEPTEFVRADIAASQIAEARANARDNGMELCRQRSRAKAAEAERDRLAADNARLRERGQAFANQVRAVTYHLNGQAYSSTVSELNAFDAALASVKGE